MRTTFLRSAQIQRRVLGALMMREVITRFGRENLGVLWLVAEPMLFTVGVGALWAAAGLNHGSSMPIEAFAITGYSSVLLWRNTVNRCSNAIQQNLTLLYHRNVQVLDVLFCRAVLEMAGATASFIILSLIFIAAGSIEPPVDMLKVIFGWLMLAWFGGSLAVLVGAATAYSEIVERIWHPAAYLLFPLSGAAFMVDWLPPAAQEVILYMPMVNGVEMVRDGYFGNAVKTHYDVGYLATVNLVLTLIGLIVQREAAKHVEAQ
jgi:ABC-type polysaccharide/polyol phosphate export permease